MAVIDDVEQLATTAVQARILLERVRQHADGAVDVVSLDTDDASETDSFFVVAERPFAAPHEDRVRRTA